MLETTNILQKVYKKKFFDGFKTTIFIGFLF